MTQVRKSARTQVLARPAGAVSAVGDADSARVSAAGRGITPLEHTGRTESQANGAPAPRRLAVHGGLTIALYWFMPTQASSVAALQFRQDGAEPQLANLRSQVAVVRALADQVEQLSRAADFDGPGAQMVEEMVRLGCRLIDAAAALAVASRVEDSGVFERATMLETVHCGLDDLSPDRECPERMDDAVSR